MSAENTLTVRLVECAKTAAQWAALLTIPKRGEICLEMENQGTNENPDLLYKMKIGDGIHTYANLNYFPVEDDIAEVVASWVEQNLDVNEYAQASYDDATKKLSVYGIKEVDGKIVKGTNHVDIQLAEGTKIDITSAAGVITIAHEGTTRTDTTKSSAGFGTNVVTGVTTDSTGHVTGVETAPLPTKPETKNVIGTSAAATTDGASANPYLNHIEDGDVKSHHQLIGGTQVDVNSDASGNVTIKHETITRSDTEESAQPTNIVTEITTTNGHVTGTKTIKPDDLTVGIAKDLDAPVVRSDNSMWNHRVTGGTINIGEDAAKISKLRGNTLVWNQLASKEIFNCIAGSKSYEGNVIVNTIDQTTQIAEIYKTRIVPSGNALYIRVQLYSTKPCTCYLNGNSSISIQVPANTWVDWTLPYILQNHCDVYYKANDTYVSGDIIKLIPIVINLTKMFSAGNEPATVEEFEAMFPNSYYPYNEGELLSLKPDGVKSVGFNLWDEQLESGSINNTTGQNTPSDADSRSKNYIRVISGQTYYINAVVYRYYYDANNNFIGYDNTETSLFTIPSNVAYLRFRQRTTDLPENICINLSSSRDGTYEPYRESTLDLSWIKSIKDNDDNQLFPYGLLSAGSVHDEVGDNYAIKRVGKYTFTGNENWLLNGDYQRTCQVNLLRKKSTSYWGEKGNCVHSKYITGAQSDIYYGIELDTIGFTDSPTYGYICCGKNVYDNRESLTGTDFYYELETPVTVYFDKKPMIYPVDDLGTETLLPEGVDSTTGVPLSAPFNGTFEYKSNFKDAVIDLINAVNNYKNPVRGKDNSDQTVGQLAEYDSDSTVKASGYKASNATISPTGSDNASTLPTVAALIAYVQGVAQNALHYQGTVVRVADLPSTETAAGDVYILSQADGNYDAGDWFIRNKANDGWDVVQGSVRVTNNDITLTPDGTKKTIANVEGTPITVTMPDMNFSEPTASGDTLTVVDTISQSSGKISATKKTIQDASKSQKGVVQFVNDIHNSTDQNKAVTAGDAWTEFAKRNVKAVDVSQSTPINLYPSVLVSSSAPSASTVPSNWNTSIYGTWTGAPQFVGQLFVSTSGSASIATGTSNVTDWIPITNN